MTLHISSTYASEVAVAERLAREAGALVMRYRSDDLAVEMKAGNEPVTEADKRASALIVSGLRAAFPDDVVISEENADDLRRLDADRVWYVDPIDGTKDFIRGREGFAVMIGLACGHVPTLGVVYHPLHDRLFIAADDGAYFLAPGAPPRRLQVSEVQSTDDLRLVASSSNRNRTIDQVKSALGIRDEYNIGSVGLKLALIALAERDLYVNPNSYCKVWDTCAPEAILRASGGKLTDVYGQPLRYDLEDIGRPSGLVASNGVVHDRVIARLASVFPAEGPAKG